MTVVNSTWTPEKIKQLKKLLGKGKSSFEIGKELGISKNAVIGKIHRLGLNMPKAPEEKVVVVQKENKKVQKLTHVGLLDLKFNSCRWPIGEPKDKDFHFCGAVCQTGKPYCPEHCKIAYTSLKELSLQNAKKEPVVKEGKTTEKTAVKEVPEKKKETAVAPKQKKEAGTGKKEVASVSSKTTKGVQTPVKKKEEKKTTAGVKTKTVPVKAKEAAPKTKVTTKGMTPSKTVKAGDKKSVKKVAVSGKKTVTVEKEPAKKAVIKKEPVKKTVVKKAPVKKEPAKKTAVKKAPVKTTVKVPVKKEAPKKETPKKETSKKELIKKEPVAPKESVKKVMLKRSVSDRLLSLMKKIKK